MKIILKGFAFILTGAALFLAGPTWADDWPNRPLTMVIGFAAGGSTDIQGRVLANVMEEYLGQPVNVVNQPGAGSAVAYTRLANNRDQGRTFLYGSITALTFTPIITRVGYDIEDFEFLATLALGQNAIVAGAGQPFSTFAELVDYGRENRLTYAQQTALDEAIMRRIATIEDINVAIVPTGGGGGMAPLVLAQQVNFAYSGGTHAQYTDTGEMLLLAFMGPERSPFYPNVPTLMELGYDMFMEDYRVIAVPAGIPERARERLIAAAEYASRSQRFRRVTEENTRFPVVFRDREATELAIRRIRAVNEAVLGD